MSQNVVMVQDPIGEATGIFFINFLDSFSIKEFFNTQSQSSSQTSQSSSQNDDLFYVTRAHVMAQQQITTMYVDFAHILSYASHLSDVILDSYYRMEPFISAAIGNFMRKHVPEYAIEGTHERIFHVSLYNMPILFSTRQLRSASIGGLVAVHGTVTRTSQSRPELTLGTFKCQDCGELIRNVRQQFKYTEPVVCINEQCNNTKNFLLEASLSTFVDWQQIRLQENASDIPAGSMPRSITVILRNELVETAKPGDKVQIAGTLIVVPDVNQMMKGSSATTSHEDRGRLEESEGITGLKALGVRDLTYKLCFLASNVGIVSHTGLMSVPTCITQANVDPNLLDVLTDFTLDQRRSVIEMKQDVNCVSKIIRSFAPNIFGHEMIKKGILLMLLGGVHKTTADKANLRGDINVCVVGDPSTSKSQFLKYVCKFVPRAIYTSGKASSAAGLTASVAKDTETGEYTIEAGALMLADKGVCCIDEFDKMDAKDQSAIHEAMEQQTISIAKAGIQATLNARTSILAAANPIYGRYDKTKSLRNNVDISAPIMSRFDLFFVVVDECDDDVDRKLAKHIVAQHRDKVAQGLAAINNELHENIFFRAFQPDYSMDQIQTYIRFAKTLNPVMTPAAKEALVNHYDELRCNDAVGSNRSSYRITVRQLESLIRLSEALARLHLEEEVTEDHVHEAAELLQQSVMKVSANDIEMFDADNQDGGDGSDSDSEDGDDGDVPASLPAIALPKPSSRAGNKKKSKSTDMSDDIDENPQNNSKTNRKRKTPTSDETIKTDETDGEDEDQKAKREKKDKKSKKDKKDKKDKKEKKKVVVSRQEYRRIAAMATIHLQSLERAGAPRLTKDALSDWLTEQQQQVKSDIDANELRQYKKMCELVINMLVTHDKQFIEVGGHICVHPNYSIEDNNLITDTQKIKSSDTSHLDDNEIEAEVRKTLSKVSGEDI